MDNIIEPEYQDNYADEAVHNDFYSSAYHGLNIKKQHFHNAKQHSLKSALHKSAIKLLKILGKAKGSLALFSIIMEWASDAHYGGVYNEDDKAPTRSTVIAHILKDTNLSQLKPKSNKVFLPNANIHINVTTHDVENGICSLLLDPRLFQDCNLCFLTQLIHSLDQIQLLMITYMGIFIQVNG